MTHLLMGGPQQALGRKVRDAARAIFEGIVA